MRTRRPWSRSARMWSRTASNRLAALARPHIGEIARPAAPRRRTRAPRLAGSKGRERSDAAAGERGLPFALVEIKLLGLDRAVDRRARSGGTHLLARAIEIGDLLEPVMPHRIRLVIERDRGLGQVIEHGLQALVIERQPMLHADIAPAGAHRFVERIVVGDGAELLAIARAEAADRRLVEQHLADRPQHRALERAGGALGQRIEGRASPRSRRRRNRAAPARARRTETGRQCRRGWRTRPPRARCRCADSRCARET